MCHLKRGRIANYTGQFGYIRCSADVVIPIDQQDSMINGAGGQDKWTVRTLKGSGHSPFLSRPDEVAAAVDGIVRQFEVSGVEQLNYTVVYSKESKQIETVISRSTGDIEEEEEASNIHKEVFDHMIA